MTRITAFVVVGFKSNMRDLLMSKPDDISPLSGVELVRKKVILVSDMGGRYPSQDAKSSFNFRMVEGAAKYYVENKGRKMSVTTEWKNLDKFEDLLVKRLAGK